MTLYFIALTVFGIIMGIAPGIIADNVKICGDETCKLAEKHKAACKIRGWLYIFGLVIYLSWALLFGRVCYDYDKQIKELKTGIEVLEKQISQTDTTTINIQNL